MKKKLFAVALIVLMSISAVFAGDLFSFDFVANTPLYKESIADPYAFSSALHLMMIPKAEDNEFRVKLLVQDTATQELMYDDFYYRNPRNANENLYINMKLAGNASLLRARFNGYKWLPSVDLDLNLLGYINTVFWLFGANDTLDFDGSYQVSASLRLADTLTFRVGMHHFSGHYGDETLEDMYTFNQIDFSHDGLINNYTGSKAQAGHEYRFVSATEYVRDNSWILGVQAELPYGIRVYGQADVPQKDAWIRPFIHVPADYTNPASGDPNDESSIHRSGWGEGADQEPGLIDAEEAQKRGSNYMALRIHGGIEYTLSFSWANIMLSADVQAHQDGQNRDANGNHEIKAYSPENMWEFEYTVGAALDLKEKIGNRNVKVEAFYHVGRTPATQWFYKTGSFIYFGLGLN